MLIIEFRNRWPCPTHLLIGCFDAEGRGGSHCALQCFPPAVWPFEDLHAKGMSMAEHDGYDMYMINQLLKKRSRVVCQYA